MRLHLFVLAVACFVGACSPQANPIDSALAAAGSPQRIVVLGPSTTENLFALGLGARVVGVSDYCSTAEAANLPHVGGLADPSLERILALAPDLVLVQGHIPKVEQLCAANHIAFHACTTDTLREWREEIQWLGNRFQVRSAAEALLQKFDQELLGFTPSSPSSRPKVLLVIFRRQEEASALMVAGDQGFLNELLELVGGTNALDGSHRDYFDLNEERLIRAAPEVILELKTDAQAEQRSVLDAQALAVWRRSFPNLPAVQSERIYNLIGSQLLLPGPSMLETARQMRAALEH